MNDSRVQDSEAASVSELKHVEPASEASAFSQDELQKIRLMYAERLRYSESLRLEVEDKLERLEDTYSELLEKHRLDTRELLGKLIDAKDFSQQLTLAGVDVEKRLYLATEQCRLLEKERDILVSNVETLQSQMVVMDQSNAQDVERYELAIRELGERLAELLAQKNAIDAEQRELNQKVVERSEEVERLQSALISALGCLESTLEENKRTVDELSLQKVELRRENTFISDQLIENNQRISQLETALQAATERFESKRLIDEVAQKQLLQQLEDLEKELSLMAEKVKITVTISSLQKEVERYRTALVMSEKNAEALRRSTSFLLGAELIQASRSFKSFLKLPITLVKLKRRVRVKGSAAQRQLPSPGNVLEEWFAELTTIFTGKGLPAAEQFAREQASDQIELANALTQLAKLSITFDAGQAIRLARESAAADPRAYRSKWLAFLLFDAGYIREANELLQGLPKDAKLTASQRYKANYISGCNRLLVGGLAIPEAAANPVIEPLSRRVLYVASSSQPYHISGYTSRTHGILQAIQGNGWNVTCVTRPGYPYDRTDALVKPLEGGNSLDGINYEALQGPHRRKVPLDEYLLKSADIIEAKAREERPTLIHAASNYETALPALIAARRLGIPFVYEVRGLWEYTSASKTPGWEQTERFTLDRELEALTAKNSNLVLTLTAAMGQELQARGVPADRIYLAPNAVDPNNFIPQPKDQELAKHYGLENSPFVVGYIGSILGYEGLDDLLHAFSELRTNIPDAKLLIVGDGDAMPVLLDLARQLRLENSVVFTGKISPSAVKQYFSLLNAVALPRKPYKVCQLVSPLKPLEAMAMGVPLVVSDVAALKEMVRDGETALVHTSSDITSLTTALLRLAQEQGLAARLAQAARQDVLVSRTWQQVGVNVSMHYTGLLRLEAVIGVGAGFGLEAGPMLTAGSSATFTGYEPCERQPVQSIEPIALPPGKNAMTAEEKHLFDSRLAAAVRIGSDALIELITQQSAGRSTKFSAFCQIKGANHLLSSGNVASAVSLAEQAISNDPGITTLRGAARICYNAANMEKACELVDRLAQLEGTTERDKQFIDEVQGRARLIDWACQPAEPRTLPVQPKRVLNILAFSLPYTSVGYATRSHGLAQGIQNAGWDIRPYTRPGFPYDFKPELEGQILPQSDEVDGVTYRRLFDIKRNDMNEVDYLFSAIAHYERVIEEEQPQIVHAASNYVTALPALIAARRKGVPFVYEVRGFWEVTRSSRDESFVHTGKYRFMQLFEGLVARQADALITITSAMREELIGRGVVPERIAVAYNSVDPERFLPRPANLELAQRLGIPQGLPVIGYIGSFVDYEGLDDLISAAAGLKLKGYEFRLLLVGDGAVFDSLREQVEVLGLQQEVLLTGRVPHDEVEDYYSLIDIAPFPRKPWEVCELVSPLKPFEAMALQKAVVVSSTRALLEIVEDGYNGLVFEKGSQASLQDALEQLLTEAEQRRQLGVNARKWITQERSWDVAGKVCGRAYVL